MAYSLFQLIAAPFTAFGLDGGLRIEQVERQVQHLIEMGVNGAFVCGSTGEGAAMSVEERMAVTLRWCEVSPKDFRVFAHVGHTASGTARALAAHAQEVGADAVAMLAPFYFKPACVADLVACCAEVASAAPSLPFYFYHLPAMTGVLFPMTEFFTAAAERIPNFAGIKYTYEDMFDFGGCVELAGDQREMFFGRDEALICGLAMGARAAIGSTFNYAGPLYRRLINAFDAGRLAQARIEQANAWRFMEFIIRHGGQRINKAINNLAGVDCGPVRSPLRPLDSTEMLKLRQSLDAVGFFEMIAPDASAVR